MKNRKAKFITLAVVVSISFAIAAVLAYVLIRPIPSSEATTEQQTPRSLPTPTTPESAVPEAKVMYVGQEITVGNGLKVTVPNGWRASVSSQPSFLGVQFARPDEIESLVYDKNSTSAIDYNGIPSWSGLTEHFYIRRITSSSQVFNPTDHAEVISEEFTFSDGTIGTRYSITKHTVEAAKYGGLLKDSEWYGRVFVYSKDDAIIEAHLAYYPSTKIMPDFYEKVVDSIKITD